MAKLVFVFFAQVSTSAPWWQKFEPLPSYCLTFIDITAQTPRDALRYIQRYFEIFGDTLRYFEIFLGIWKYFEIFGDTLRYLEISRDTLKYVEEL